MYFTALPREMQFHHETQTQKMAKTKFFSAHWLMNIINED